MGLFLLILLSGLILFNKAKIEQNLKNTQFFEQFKVKTTTQTKKPEIKQEPTDTPPVSNPKEPQSIPTAIPQRTVTKQNEPEGPSHPITKPEELPRAPQTSPKETTTQSIHAATKNQPQKPEPSAVSKEKQPQSKNRNLYFMQLTEDGSLIRSKVSRTIIISDSPLMDVLQSLLAGPTEIEKKLGLMSAIPPGSKLLSAAVTEGIAYLNFNDAFQFNTYGVEGYTAQLKQVVWTATEFSTVRGVQFLIEGKRLTYLGGEGIRIDKPLSRESF